MESGRRHACGVQGRGRARRQLASVCLLWHRLHGEVRSERRRHAGRHNVGAFSKRAALAESAGGGTAAYILVRGFPVRQDNMLPLPTVLSRL